MQASLHPRSFPALFLASEMTIGQSDAANLLGRRMAQCYDHVRLLHNASAFESIGDYAPFRPTRTFSVRHVFRFSGKMAALPFQFEE